MGWVGLGVGRYGVGSVGAVESVNSARLAEDSQHSPDQRAGGGDPAHDADVLHDVAGRQRQQAHAVGRGARGRLSALRFAADDPGQRVRLHRLQGAL